MPRTVTIYVPCDVVPIRVRFRRGDYISPIELTVLEVLASGSRGTEELADLLCLSERMTLDIISDLWRLGYVVLDFARGEVRLSEATAARAAQGMLDQLPGAEDGGSVVKIMYERLSGHVLPFGGRRNPANSRLAVPAEGSGKTIEDASPAQLLRAVQQVVDSGKATAGGLQRRVVAAHLSPANLRDQVERMWLPLDVRVGMDDDTERLKVTVLGNLLPESRRTEAARSLARFAEEFPKHRFAQALRSEADPEYVDPPSLRELVDRMERQVDAAASARAGTRGQHHRELRRTAFSAASQLAAVVAREVNATPVFGRPKERAVLRTIIREAHAQIVIVSPLIRMAGLEEFFELLASALSRGVQVVIVWGRSPNEQLDPAVQRALSQLARPHGGHADEGQPDMARLKVLWSARPARVNVTIAIADDRIALVTGDALLASAGAVNVTQLGVQLTAPRPRERCLPIEQLLEWAGRAIPEYRLANAMFVRYEDFQLGDETQQPADGTESYREEQHRSDRHGLGVKPDSTADAIWSDALADLPGDPPETDEDLDQARPAAWCRAWAEFVVRFRGLVTARSMPQARLVEDDEHRELMWQALRKSSSRLLIGSPELSHTMLTDQMLTALRDRLADGVDVTLMYSSTAPHKQEENEKTLTELAGQHGFRLQKLPTNARFLISDTEIMIGSYRYLSTTARGSYTRRSELSIFLTAPSITDAVTTVLCKPGPGGILRPASVPPSVSPAEYTASHRDETPPSQPSTAILATQRLLDRVAAAETETERAKIIREVLDAEADPWAIVDYLRNVGASAAVIRLATAASWNRPGEDAYAGQEWLIRDLWRSRQFVEASILRESLPNPDLRPSSALARVAAARGSVDAPEALLDAALDELTPPERALLSLLSAAELLIGPRPGQQGLDGQEISEILGVLISGLHEPWHAFAEAAQSYWGEVGEPMPMWRFQAAAHQVHDTEQVTRAWDELCDTLAKAAQTTFAPVHGRKAHTLLFDPGHAFGKLRSAVKSRDLAAVEVWTRLPEIADLGALVDATTAEISAQVTALAGPARRAYLARLSAVVKAAQRLAADADKSGGQTAMISAEAEAMARRLGAQWDGLVTAAEQLAEPERFLAHAVLNDLNVIHDWVVS